MMKHLGDRIVSLVDGELDHDARERVLAHLALCSECRREADEQRRLKSELSGLGAPPPPSDLMERLYGMSGPDGPIAMDTEPTTVGSSGAADLRRGPFVAERGDRGGPRRSGLAAAGLVGLAVTAATAFVVGDRADPQVRITPPVDRYAVEHAVTVQSGPLGNPAIGSAGLPGSAVLPVTGR